MSSLRSRAAVRFVVATFLAQTFVNAAVVPHLHKVHDVRQVVSLPIAERQEPANDEPSENLFDALVNTLRGYNGLEVFQDFFTKLFNVNSDDDEPTTSDPAIVIVPTSVNVVSAIESFVSEIANMTAPAVFVPPVPSETSEASTTSEGMMYIQPIFPITTAIELFPSEEPSLPSELASELLPEATGVVAPFEANATEVVIALPTGALTAPVVLVTAPIVTGPIEAAVTAVEVPFPIANGTISVAEVLATGISSPLNETTEINITVDVAIPVVPTLIGTGVASAGTELPVALTIEALFPNATAEAPTIVLVTGTGAAVGTGVPTFAIEAIGAPFANSTSDVAIDAPLGTGVVVLGTGMIGTGVEIAVAPVETAILGTGIVGTGIVGTGFEIAVAPVETALPLFPNTTAAIEIAVAPVETTILGTGMIGTGISVAVAPVATAILGTGIVGTGFEIAVAPVETALPLFSNTTTAIEIAVAPVETAILGTGMIGTGISVAVAPVETDLPLFTNATAAVEVAVAPTLLITGTAPAVPAISAAAVVSEAADAIFSNTTTTTVTNFVTPVLGTAVVTDAPATGTIVVVAGADNTDALFLNTTVTINTAADPTLSGLLALVTDLPSETSDVPVAPVFPTGFPTIPVEAIAPGAPIIEPIPTDAPLVEFPGQPTVPVLPIDTPLVDPLLPVTPPVPVFEPAPIPEFTASTLPFFPEDPSTIEPAILPAPVPALPILPQ